MARPSHPKARSATRPAPPRPASSRRRAASFAGAITVGVALGAAVAIGLWLWRATGPDAVSALGPPGAGRLAVDRTPDQNVLLVTIDTLRADALSFSGGRAATPALDRLAAEGARFTNARAHAVVTLPSHASILTGRYPFEHGVRDNSGYRLSGEVPTLATILKERGFQTGAFVGAFPVSAQFGLQRGFDEYDDRLGASRGPSEFTFAERRADVVVGAALEWVRARNRRWFAWVHVFDPHAPYRPPPPYDRQYADAPYAGEVAWTDAALAPLLSAVRDAQARPTLVVVTADHGEALGEHGEATHGLFAYDPTLRVPLLVAQVGGPTPGRPQAVVREDHAGHVDLAPTVLDALGWPAPAAWPGRSLLVAAAAAGEPAGSRALYFEAMSAFLNRGWAPLQGVVNGRYKLIELPLPEVYDLERDPAERSNLFDNDSSRARTLAARLRSFDAPLPATRAAESHAVTERLRALGYVSSVGPRRSAHPTADDDPKRLVQLDVRLHEAVDRIERGDLPGAAAIYRDLMQRRPDFGLAYLHLSYVLWELGRPSEAIDTLRQALTRNAGRASAEAQLGIYLAEAGDADEAVRVLANALAETPHDVDAINALGIAHARAGRPAEADAAFRRVLAVDASNHHALENLGALALGRGDPAAARSAFEAALRSAPTSGAAYAGLGAAQLQQGDRAAALVSLERAVVLDPAQFDALYNLGIALHEAGRTQEARAYLERFVRTAPAWRHSDDIRRVQRLLRGGRTG